MTRNTPHRLLKVIEKRCKCGRYFIDISHTHKYCSDECKKKFSRNWSQIRQDFNQENPDLCSYCGCKNIGSVYKLCLDCRLRAREYSRKRKENKK
jgi:hypothetical protein